MLSPSILPSSITLFNNSFALSITCFLLTTLTSSTSSEVIVALQGPTLSILSKAAASITVSTLSKDVGRVIFPELFPFLDSNSTSILPTLADLCNSLKSNSVPRRPSVWPNIAPTTSDFSITPSALIVALIKYFVVAGSITIC